MRMRHWAMAAMATAAFLIGNTKAAAQTEPTIEVRLRSVDDLLERGQYIGGLIGKDEEVKQVRDLVKQLAKDGKGVEGVDPKRPFGVYSTLTQDVASSPVVIMIPVADKDRLLAALKDRLGIVPEKADDGTMKVNVPILNEAHLRFANDYLYVAREPKQLDTKTLVSPKAFFAKDDGAVLSVLVHVDKIPAELKTFVFGQLELGVQQELKKDAGNAAEKKLKGLVFDTVLGGTKSVMDDTKDATLKLFVDPKADDLSVEFTLIPKTGTPLAKTITGLAGKTSLPAGIVDSKSLVANGNVKIELTPDMKKRFNSAIDELIAAAVKEAGDQNVAQKIFDALGPTLKSGELDLAASLTGPDAKGRHGLLAAVGVKKGKDIEALIKEFAPFIPGDAAEVTFDVEKIGSFTLHKIEIKQPVEQFEKVFGTKNLWLAISDDCIAVSIEPDGAALKAGLKAKPVAVPLLSGNVALAKMIPLVNRDLKPDELKALLKDAFGGEPTTGKDTVGITLEGGDKLTFKIKGKGKAIGLGTTMTVIKG